MSYTLPDGRDWKDACADSLARLDEPARASFISSVGSAIHEDFVPDEATIAQMVDDILDDTSVEAIIARADSGERLTAHGHGGRPHRGMPLAASTSNQGASL